MTIKIIYYFVIVFTLLEILQNESNGQTGWIRQYYDRNDNFFGVSFTNTNTGTTVGRSGKILHTENCGSTWTQQESKTTANLFGIAFTDAHKGIICGDNGTILRTTNGGITWEKQLSGTTYDLYGVSYTDSSNGTIVGTGGTILRTTNGGTTWTKQNDTTGTDYFGVCFIDTNIGTVVGANGTILRTTNGGLTWIMQPCGVTAYLLGASFTNSTTGTVVGWANTILHTTDGGFKWIKQSFVDKNPEIINHLWNSVCFTDDSIGTIVGCYGDIIRTFDGGNTWIDYSIPGYGNINGVHFFNADNGYVVGTGFIFYTNDGGMVSEVKNEFDSTLEKSKQFALLQNFPNPFNPFTTISFSLPESRNVELKVFDILGKEVAVLLNEYRSAGEHKVEFNGNNLSSGVYFYQLKAGNFRQTKKLVLLK